MLVVFLSAHSPRRFWPTARNQRADGSGDLIFTRTRQVNWQNTTDGPRSNTSVAGFYAVADVKHVDDLVQDTFEKSF